MDTIAQNQNPEKGGMVATVSNYNGKPTVFVNGKQMAIVVMTRQSSITEATTQISVPGYKYQESTGIGDARVMTGTKDKQTIILGKDGLIVLIYERNNSSL